MVSSLHEGCCVWRHYILGQSRSDCAVPAATSSSLRRGQARSIAINPHRDWPPGVYIAPIMFRDPTALSREFDPATYFMFIQTAYSLSDTRTEVGSRLVDLAHTSFDRAPLGHVSRLCLRVSQCTLQRTEFVIPHRQAVATNYSPHKDSVSSLGRFRLSRLKDTVGEVLICAAATAVAVY